MPKLIIPMKFKKVLAKKTPQMQAAVLDCVKQLGTNPRHPGLNTHRVQGRVGVWEAYVDAGNRITFDYDDDGAIRLRNNCNHSILDKSP